MGYRRKIDTRTDKEERLKEKEIKERNYKSEGQGKNGRSRKEDCEGVVEQDEKRRKIIFCMI